MKVENWNIEDVKPYKNNPRKNDEAVEPTAKSIEQFGWQQPIVVDKNGVVIVGHTRLKAAKSLDLDKVPVVVADNLTDEQVKAYRIADNSVSDLSDWDTPMLDAELLGIKDLDMSDFGINIIGFDELSSSKEATQKFKNDFLVSPFSVINTASGEMMKRKKMWNSIIKDVGQARNTHKQKAFNEPSKLIQQRISLMNPAVCELINRWFLPLDTSSKTFDCFSGDTAFGFVSSKLGNSFTGIELRKEQVDFNNERVADFGLDAKYIEDDGRNVRKHIEKESQDLLFSCPPYFDLEVYSDKKEDASNQGTYEEFLQIIETAFTNAISCIKQNRFATIVVGDVRDKNGYYYNFVDDVKNIFIKNGMPLYNEIILQDPLGSAPMRARGQMRSRKVVKIHQNLLVFYKGDPKQIKDIYGELSGFEELEAEDFEDEDLESEDI